MSENHCSLSQERLRELLKYCPATGLFSWLDRSNSRRIYGAVAGGRSTQGYIVIRIDGVLYLAHRLAYFYIYGAWPPADVDHKNGDKTDNRLDNIRAASRSQNNQNRRRGKSRDGESSMGITWAPWAKMWRAQISVDGAHRHIGYYKTMEEANAAYLNEKRKSHEFCMI